jgi:hypothetical protein
VSAPPQIEIVELQADSHSARCRFACSDELSRLLWDERVLSFYCSEGVRAEPERLAAAALFALAPLGWAYGAEVSSPVPVPEPAVRCLDRLGEHLSGHYGWSPGAPFRRVATVPGEELPGEGRALAYSGGVDSARALVDLAPGLDGLVHLSNFDNLDSRITPAQRNAALAATRRTAESRGLGWLHLRTNLHSIFKHNRLDEKFPPGLSFWLGLQHVQHIATALVPVRTRLSRFFLAGGFSEPRRYARNCAAHKAFVLRYTFPAPVELVHELDRRQGKIEALLDRAPELLRELRVCYTSGDAVCAVCSKCHETALMIVAGGGSLAETNFPPAIVERLIARVEELSRLPAEGEGLGFFDQALEGRALHGSREARWAQLLRLLKEAA